MRDVLTDASIRNAMVVHAAFGGSTNLLLHIPAIAHAAKLRRPTVEDWAAVNQAHAAVSQRSAQWTGASSDRASVFSGRSSRGDAALATTGFA